MHYKLMFPSRYLDAATLQGRDATVEIESVNMETLEGEKGEKDVKPCVRLKGKKKLWVLNKTNAKIIAKLHGTEVDGWVGKRITLYPTTCEAFGETVECVRVRKTLPRAQQQVPPPQDDADGWQPDDDEAAAIAAGEANG